MTPMIDVVFLLIIFFLVSSHLAKQENSMELDLPIAQSSLDDSSVTSSVVVNVLPSGGWQVAGATVNQKRLGSVLKSRSMQSPDGLRLKIRTDRNVRYGRISPVLRLAAEAGISDIVFSVYDQPASN